MWISSLVLVFLCSFPSAISDGLPKCLEVAYARDTPCLCRIEAGSSRECLEGEICQKINFTRSLLDQCIHEDCNDLDLNTHTSCVCKMEDEIILNSIVCLSGEVCQRGSGFVECIPKAERLTSCSSLGYNFVVPNERCSCDRLTGNSELLKTRMIKECLGGEFCQTNEPYFDPFKIPIDKSACRFPRCSDVGYANDKPCLCLLKNTNAGIECMEGNKCERGTNDWDVCVQGEKKMKQCHRVEYDGNNFPKEMCSCEQWDSQTKIYILTNKVCPTYEFCEKKEVTKSRLNYKNVYILYVDYKCESYPLCSELNIYKTKPCLCQVNGGTRLNSVVCLRGEVCQRGSSFAECIPKAGRLNPCHDVGYSGVFPMKRCSCDRLNLIISPRKTIKTREIQECLDGEICQKEKKRVDAILIADQSVCRLPKCSDVGYAEIKACLCKVDDTEEGVLCKEGMRCELGANNKEECVQGENRLIQCHKVEYEANNIPKDRCACEKWDTQTKTYTQTYKACEDGYVCVKGDVTQDKLYYIDYICVHHDTLYG